MMASAHAVAATLLGVFALTTTGMAPASAARTVSGAAPPTASSVAPPPAASDVAPAATSSVLPAAAASATAPASAAVSAPPGSKPTTSLRQRLAAVNQYQHDLVSVLALRSDARHLLGAALLARPLQGQPDLLGYQSLLKRAANAADAGNALHWAQLSDCDARAQACPNAQALSALTRSAGDNAAVWLLRLDLDAKAGDDDAVAADLAKAAAAARYDDYAGDILAALVAAATALPVPRSVIKDYAAGGPAGGPAVQAFLVFGAAATLPRPNLLPAVMRCDPERADLDAAQRNRCRKLAHVLAWGSSPQARAAGLHLREVLADGATERAAAQVAQRDLEWQYREFARLRFRAMTDDAIAGQMLKLARNGGTRMSLMIALLRARGIALHAPEPAAATSSADTPSYP